MKNIYIEYQWFFFRDGLRESHVTTKYFDVNDMYTEDYSDGYSDNDQSFSRMNKSPVRLEFSFSRLRSS